MVYFKTEPEPSVPATLVSLSAPSTPSLGHFNPPQHGPRPQRTTVLALSIAVGLLAAAVVGLAAATGIMAKRASDAESAVSAQLAGGNGTAAGNGICPAMTATTTTTTTAVIVSPSGTNLPGNIDLLVADVSNGCDDEDEKITGTKYTTRREYLSFTHIKRPSNLTT